MESHKIAVIVRHLLRSLSSKFCADIDWLKQVTQDHIQSWLEGLQGWRLYKLSSTVLVFNQFPNKTGFPFYFDGFSCTLFCSCWLLSFTTESDSNFFTPSHQVFIYMDNISPQSSFPQIPVESTKEAPDTTSNAQKFLRAVQKVALLKGSETVSTCLGFCIF